MSKRKNDKLERQEKNTLIDFLPVVLKNTKSEGYLVEYHYRDKILNSPFTSLFAMLILFSANLRLQKKNKTTKKKRLHNEISLIYI